VQQIRHTPVVLGSNGLGEGRAERGGGLRHG
jgi:hypothetical protein